MGQSFSPQMEAAAAALNSKLNFNDDGRHFLVPLPGQLTAVHQYTHTESGGRHPKIETP